MQVEVVEIIVGTMEGMVVMEMVVKMAQVVCSVAKVV
jgi:hypothetical protein